MNEIALTASRDRERSGLRSSASVIAEQESNTLAGGNSNSPGERGTSKVIPGDESSTRRIVTRVNALHANRRRSINCSRRRVIMEN